MKERIKERGKFRKEKGKGGKEKEKRKKEKRKKKKDKDTSEKQKTIVLTTTVTIFYVHGLISNVTDDFRALGPVRLRVEGIRDVFVTNGGDVTWEFLYSIITLTLFYA
jgi:hypothetical protein